MLRALEINSYEQVLRVLHEDDTAAFFPLTCSISCEPPLVCAVRLGCSTKIFSVLVEYGADIAATGSSRRSALAELALCGQQGGQHVKDSALFERIKLWQEQCHVPLLPVVSSRRIESAGVRSCEGFNIDEKYKAVVPVRSNWADHNCASAVKSAIAPSSDDITCKAHCLLQLGADPWQADASGLTAIEHAMKSGRPQLADFLRHWHGRQLCRQLQTLWGRYEDDTPKRPDLLHMPISVQGLICDMLAPASTRTTSL